MIHATVIYLELFVALFLLPGYFLTIILGIRNFRFLLSFALSYSLLVLTLLPFEYYAQPISRCATFLLWEWAILAVLAAAKILVCGNSRRGILAALGSGWKPLLLYIREPNPRLIVPLVLAAVVCGYLMYAGIYLEIPSDTWGHIFKFQWQELVIIEQGCFSPASSLSSLLFNQGSGSHWYFIHAWLCHVSGLAIMDSLHVMTFINVLIFLLAMYYFGLYLFARLRISTVKKMMIAAVSSLFTAASMGFIVFAFIRYYTFAPAILSYVLFLAAMAVIIAWLRSDRWFGCAHHRWLGHALWIVPVLLMATWIIHTQESLFIFFMTLALSIVETIRVFWRKITNRKFNRLRFLRTAATPDVVAVRQNGSFRFWLAILFGKSEQAACENQWSVREWKTMILASFLLLLFIAGFIIIRYLKPGPWISAKMILPHVGIPLEPVNFIFRNLLISPPHNPWLRLAVYQLFIFYQAVGCWGLFVYLLFILMWRQFVKIPYLAAGMIIVPLLTAFNPMMIDMMARLGRDPTLYRFHYLIPLPFVGGYLFVHLLGKARESFCRMRLAPTESVSLIWPRISWIKFIVSILILAGLIGLLFPLNVAGVYAPYSKIYTLRSIPAGNDYRLFDDLGKVMAKYENKVILTDDWTARYLWNYSPKNTYSGSKWLNSSNPEKEQPVPYAWGQLCNRGLIIINRRNGGPSITGRIAKHWPEDVLPEVSRFYSLQVQTYLETHPEIFGKIWSQNQIAVYAVR